MSQEDPNVITFEKSSNIASARFDQASNTCEVEFRNGSRYSYRNFTAAMMEDWRGAKSGGTWFHSNVKQQPDSYPVTQLPAGSDKGAVERAAAEKNAKAVEPMDRLTTDKGVAGVVPAKRPADVKVPESVGGTAAPLPPLDGHTETELSLARQQTVELQKLADFLAAKCAGYPALGKSVVDRAIGVIQDLQGASPGSGTASGDLKTTKAASFRPWRRHSQPG